MKYIYTALLALVAIAAYAADPVSLQQMLQSAPKETSPQGQTSIVTVRSGVVRRFPLMSTARLVPVATTTTPGVVKVGTGLAVLPDGTLNNTGVAGVASFNGRGGAVTPTSGDYSIGQISGASTVASTGSYADLSNKPTIPAAQVNSDWNAGSGVAQILNKPTIPTSLSQLSQSSSYRTVTDAEKDQWNNNSSPVQSFNGRTGAVQPQSGDYTAVMVGADVLGSATSVQTNLNAHTSRTDNPHAVTKAQVGLSNVDNTSDLSKPVSTATQTALNLKANTSALAPVATSGAYADLTGKPTIPAAQVNSDWSAASGVAQILNKPTLGTAAAKDIPASGDASSTQVVLGSDLRLTNARTPTAHAASHASGGSDAVTPASIGALNAVYIKKVAAGDGSTDDKAAIENAIANAGDGAVIVFDPAQTYYVSAPIGMTKNRVTLKGNGAKILAPNGFLNAGYSKSTATGSSTITKGSYTVQFPAGLSVAAGDQLGCYESSQYISGYYKGFLGKVLSISGTTATLDAPSPVDATCVNFTSAYAVDGLVIENLDINTSSQPYSKNFVAAISANSYNSTYTGLTIKGSLYLGAAMLIYGNNNVVEKSTIHTALMAQGDTTGGRSGYGIDFVGQNNTAQNCTIRNTKHAVTSADRYYTGSNILWKNLTIANDDVYYGKTPYSDDPTLINGQHYITGAVDAHANVLSWTMEDCYTRTASTVILLGNGRATIKNSRFEIPALGNYGTVFSSRAEAPVDYLLLDGNTFNNTSGSQIYLDSSLSGFDNISISNSRFVNVDLNTTGATFKDNRLFRTAPPTFGTWATGNIIYNSSVSAVTPVYWICTSGGAPGTWQAVYATYAGATLPASCADGQLGVDTDAATGKRLYACESGTWVLQGDGTGSSATGDTLWPASATTNSIPTLGASKTLQNNAPLTYSSGGLINKITDGSATIQAVSTSASGGQFPSFTVGNYLGASNAGNPSMTFFNYGGAEGARTATPSGKTLLSLQANGYGGTEGSGGASGIGVAIKGITSEAWTTTSHGAYLAFYYTPKNSTTNTEGARLWDNGGFSLNNTSDPGSGNFGITGSTIYRNTTAPSATTDQVKLYNVEGDYLHILDEDGNDHKIGQGKMEAGQMVSTVATGTAPLVVTSTTKVSNLNVEQVDGADLDTDGAMAANSDTKIPTQKAVVTYAAAKVASGTAALGTSAIASGACATAVTVAGTGVLTTDVIDWGFNGDPTSTTGYTPSTSGMLTIIAYPTAGNANFKVCNNTGSSVTPGAVTLNWRVRR